jgi:hypothetical protein
MELPSPDEHVRERPRKPHWTKSNFWKTFGTMLVIYLILRFLITFVLDWSSAPAESKTGSEISSPIAAPTDQPAPANPSE